MAKKSKSLSDLPEGMITEVLLRLPVKSMLVCKSVCKPWLSIISNPHFIKTQLHRASIATDSPTLLNIINEKQMVVIESVKYPITGPDDLFDLQQQQRRRRQLVNQALGDDKAQDLSRSPLQFARALVPGHIVMAQFISCCNGIICLSYYNVAYLWNPSIKKFKQLHFHNPHRHVQLTIGFGFDSISKDYKLLRFVYEKTGDVVPIAKVFYVNDGAHRWREFQGPILKRKIKPWPSNVVVNGVLYFDGGDQLVSFDLHEELFGLLPYPDSMRRKRSDIMDFEGCVAMVFESGPGVDLWTLDSVSGELSWTKKFSIEYGLDDLDTEIWLSCYLGAKQFYGKKLLIMNGYYFLYEILYDYDNKETKYYGLREEYVNIYAFFEDSEMLVRAMLNDSQVPPHAAFKYTETLVSLVGFEPECKE